MENCIYYSSEDGNPELIHLSAALRWRGSFSLEGRGLIHYHPVERQTRSLFASVLLEGDNPVKDNLIVRGVRIHRLVNR